VRCDVGGRRKEFCPPFLAPVLPSWLPSWLSLPLVYYMCIILYYIILYYMRLYSEITLRFTGIPYVTPPFCTLHLLSLFISHVSSSSVQSLFRLFYNTFLDHTSALKSARPAIWDDMIWDDMIWDDTIWDDMILCDIMWDDLTCKCLLAHWLFFTSIHGLVVPCVVSCSPRLVAQPNCEIASATYIGPCVRFLRFLNLLIFCHI
jgi:hypothetical protein